MPFDQQGNITKPTILHWRERISARDRKATDAVSKWLRPVAWQWFITITFPWDARAETADNKLRQLANSLEKSLRANVCFVAARESKPFTYEDRVPHHFHLLLASAAPIPSEFVQCHWRRLVRGAASEHVRIEPYDQNRLGPEYCLKSIRDSEGDWFLHRLEHFLPQIKGKSKPNHRTIRAAKRAALQLVNFGKR